MHVAVAIVGFRNAGDIVHCLAALGASTHTDFEVVICENGGAAAYQALSPTMRTFLDGLSAVHDFAHAFPSEGLAAQNAGADRHLSASAAHPPVIHPVVRVHPETGEKALFVNSVFTARIKGMRREESRALLDFLYTHVQQPDFAVRWRWKPGAVAFWDNRCTQHYAVNDYLPHRRVLTRATVNGDRPVGVAS